MSTNANKPEVWMRGSIAGVPALLQPVAHALLQAQEDVEHLLDGFDDRLLWSKPGGMASIGFHLRHITGVVDRMFAYAHEQALTADQFAYLRSESDADEIVSTPVLVATFGHQVQQAIQQLRSIDESRLTEIRYLGRKRIPTTMVGLLFHAAEHTQRHVGQLIVTVNWVRQS